MTQPLQHLVVTGVLAVASDDPPSTEPSTTTATARYPADDASPVPQTHGDRMEETDGDRRRP